jgi:hypothetical protein
MSSHEVRLKKGEGGGGGGGATAVWGGGGGRGNPLCVPLEKIVPAKREGEG